MKTAFVLYGATSALQRFSADIFWRTRFAAPDPFFLVEIGEKTTIFVSSLEFGRAKKEAKADKIILLQNGGSRREAKEEVTEFLKKHGATEILVPSHFPYYLGKFFEKEFRVAVKEPPCYPAREKKTAWEIEEIEKVQRAAENTLADACEFLKTATIRDNAILHGGEAVTSEMLRDFINARLYAQGCIAIHTIVAGGVQAADPHCIGFGPLVPYAPLIIDIFPFSQETHYFADQTRTVFKGEPQEDVKHMYEVIRSAQENAIKKIKAGIDGKEIYEETIRFFDANGFPTVQAQSEGFIHGLGHGLGLEIHESPRLGGTRAVLQEGNVITVEPGLYYPEKSGPVPEGGIRIEDVVVVEKTGCRNLTRFSKKLEEMIL